jgi:hypothetical protein
MEPIVIANLAANISVRRLTALTPQRNTAATQRLSWQIAFRCIFQVRFGFERKDAEAIHSGSLQVV